MDGTKSAQYKASKKWNGENLKTVAATVRVDIADQFKTCCRNNGTTAHAVLKEFIQEYINKYSGPVE